MYPAFLLILINTFSGKKVHDKNCYKEGIFHMVLIRTFCLTNIKVKSNETPTFNQKILN